MKKSELTQLRSLVNAEITRKKQINELLDKEDVIKYIKLIEGSTEKIDTDDIREILKEILKDFKVKETNGIYVCTAAFDEDSRAPVIYYQKPDNKYTPDKKKYKDIESGEEITTDWIYGPQIDQFERINTVLNPYNAAYNSKKIKENGFEEVQLYFYEESYRNGQYSAIKKVLKKYPRIGSYKS